MCASSRRLRAAIIGLALTFAPPTDVLALGFTVNSTVDAIDVNPGDGLCATATAVCSLRAAIQETNARAGDDTITLPAGVYTLTIAGAGEEAAAAGDLDITGNLVIQGVGNPVIDANGTILFDRVFHITGPFVVSIVGVDVRGGRTEHNAGGGIFVAGGAALTLTNTSVIDNASQFGTGGGIRTDGATLTLNNSTVSNNHADGGAGGGIFTAGALTTSNSTITGNSATVGGGIFNFLSRTATLNNTTVADNTAAAVGGGIANLGTLTITNSTLSGNTSDFRGGAIDNDNGGSVVLTNTTVFGNAAAVEGGGVSNVSGITILRNTIVAGAISGANCTGAMSDGGANLSWPDATCPGINLDPVLAPLADNGGPTQTHALLPRSAAIDAAIGASCPATDQRGVLRPQGVACDIGAFEFAAVMQPIDVTIDIKPGGRVNSINSKSRGRIPVAILSTADFDVVSRLDLTSLTFGSTGDEPSLAFCNGGYTDVNSDGRPDLVCHFATELAGFRPGDTSGVLKGTTVDANPLRGTDTVRIVR